MTCLIVGYFFYQSQRKESDNSANAERKAVEQTENSATEEVSGDADEAVKRNPSQQHEKSLDVDGREVPERKVVLESLKILLESVKKAEKDLQTEINSLKNSSSLEEKFKNKEAVAIRLVHQLQVSIDFSSSISCVEKSHFQAISAARNLLSTKFGMGNLSS